MRRSRSIRSELTSRKADLFSIAPMRGLRRHKTRRALVIREEGRRRGSTDCGKAGRDKDPAWRCDHGAGTTPPRAGREDQRACGTGRPQRPWTRRGDSRDGARWRWLRVSPLLGRRDRRNGCPIGLDVLRAARCPAGRGARHSRRRRRRGARRRIYVSVGPRRSDNCWAVFTVTQPCHACGNGQSRPKSTTLGRPRSRSDARAG